MKKSKAVLSIVLVLCLLIALSSQALASVQPRFMFASSFVATLDISATGLSDVYAAVSVPNSRYTIKLSATLQQKNDGDWKDVKTWETEGVMSASINKPWYVASGFDYRIMTSIDVYDANNSYIGTDTTYSAIVHH